MHDHELTNTYKVIKNYPIPEKDRNKLLKAVKKDFEDMVADFEEGIDELRTDTVKDAIIIAETITIYLLHRKFGFGKAGVAKFRTEWDGFSDKVASGEVDYGEVQDELVRMKLLDVEEILNAKFM